MTEGIRHTLTAECRLAEESVRGAELRGLRVQTRAEGRKGILKLASKLGEDADDGNAHHGSNHAVFDSSRAGLISDEALGDVLHDDLHLL